MNNNYTIEMFLSELVKIYNSDEFSQDFKDQVSEIIAGTREKYTVLELMKKYN